MVIPTRQLSADRVRLAAGRCEPPTAETTMVRSAGRLSSAS